MCWPSRPWLDTRDAPAEDCFERRLECIAGLNARYPVQLAQRPAAEYVAIKRREWLEHTERVIGPAEEQRR